MLKQIFIHVRGNFFKTHTSFYINTYQNINCISKITKLYFRNALDLPMQLFIAIMCDGNFA